MDTAADGRNTAILDQDISLDDVGSRDRVDGGSNDEVAGRRLRQYVSIGIESVGCDCVRRHRVGIDSKGVVAFEEYFTLDESLHTLRVVAEGMTFPDGDVAVLTDFQRAYAFIYPEFDGGIDGNHAQCMIHAHPVPEGLCGVLSDGNGS